MARLAHPYTRRPSARVRRRRLVALAVLVAVVVVLTRTLVGSSPARRPTASGATHGPAVPGATQGPAASGATLPGQAVAPTTTPADAATSPTTTTTTTPSALPPADNGQLPQDGQEPSPDTPAFRAEMAALWAAVQSGDPGVAAPAFFPESAYLQVKALYNDEADYLERLVPHFALDVAAAHQLLGPDAAGARLVQTLVPDQAAWIPPGACANRAGYWHLPGSRMVYVEDGQVRSFGIASLISWRGYWYVVHLGAVLPPAGVGVTDDPSSGTGAYGSAGGC